MAVPARLRKPSSTPSRTIPTGCARPRRGGLALAAPGGSAGGALGGAGGLARFRLRGVALLLALGARAEKVEDLLADLLQLQAEVHEDLGGHAVLLAEQAEQEVLRPHVVVVQVPRLLDGVLDDLLGPRRLRELAHRHHLGSALDQLLHLQAHLAEIDVQVLEDVGADAGALLHQTQEDVLRPDVLVVEALGFLVRQGHHLAGSIGQSLEHAGLLLAAVAAWTTLRIRRADIRNPDREPRADRRRPPLEAPPPQPAPPAGPKGGSAEAAAGLRAAPANLERQMHPRFPAIPTLGHRAARGATAWRRAAGFALLVVLTGLLAPRALGMPRQGAMKGLKAISAANEQVALHVQQENDANVLVEISPLIAQTTTVQVQVGTDVRAKQTMQFKPLQTVSIRAPHTATEPLTILVGNHVVYRSNAAQAEANPTTAFTSAQTALQQRDLAQAKARYEATLAQNPNDAAALIGLGALYVQLHNGYEAVNVLTRARAQNPSSAEAAYCYGLAQREWGTTAEAQEAFKTALDSAEWQVPAALQLAELAIAAKQYAAALTYVQKGLAQQPSHALLLATKAVIHRLKGQTALAQTAVTGLLKTDPLNTIALVEQWILSKNTTKKQALTQNLLTTDAFMEVALWYARMGRTEDASALLNVYDEQVKRHKVAAHPEPYFWLGEWAFVQPTAAMKPYDRAKAWYQKAVGMSAEGITFFRPESAGVLHRAYEILPHWKTALYWAQLRAHALDPQLALQLLDDQADRPDFAPFYAFRASLREATRPQDAQTDLERAAQLAPSEWRYGVLLNQFFRRQNKPAKALDVIRTYLQRLPGKEMVGIEFAKTAYEQNEFALCADVLRDQFITPSSQNTDAQRYWRDCNLRMAFNGIKARQYAPAMEATKAAMSRPARLGTPPADQDLRLVEFTEALVWEGLGKPEKAAEGFQKVANFSPNNEFTPADGLTALALESLRRPQDAIRGVRAALARNPQNPFARWTDLYFKNAQDDPTPEMMTNREFVMTLKLLESLAK